MVTCNAAAVGLADSSSLPAPVPTAEGAGAKVNGAAAIAAGWVTFVLDGPDSKAEAATDGVAGGATVRMPTDEAKDSKDSPPHPSIDVMIDPVGAEIPPPPVVAREDIGNDPKR